LDEGLRVSWNPLEAKWDPWLSASGRDLHRRCHVNCYK